jgi:hypothetical protein
MKTTAVAILCLLLTSHCGACIAQTNDPGDQGLTFGFNYVIKKERLDKFGIKPILRITEKKTTQKLLSYQLQINTNDGTKKDTINRVFTKVEEEDKIDTPIPTEYFKIIKKFNLSIDAKNQELTLSPWGIKINKDTTKSKVRTFESNIDSSNSIKSFDAIHNSEDGNIKILLRAKKTNREVTTYFWLPYRNTSISLITVPFRIRFSSGGDSLQPIGDVNVNLGIYVGKTWGYTRFIRGRTPVNSSFSIGGIIQPSIQNISYQHLANFRNKKDEFTKKYSSESLTTPSLGIGIGIVYHYKGFEAGAFSGYDILLRKGFQRHWLYGRAPWLGIGIGYKIGLIKL